MRYRVTPADQRTPPPIQTRYHSSRKGDRPVWNIDEPSGEMGIGRRKGREVGLSIDIDNQAHAPPPRSAACRKGKALIDKLVRWRGSEETQGTSGEPHRSGVPLGTDYITPAVGLAAGPGLGFQPERLQLLPFNHRFGFKFINMEGSHHQRVMPK